MFGWRDRLFIGFVQIWKVHFVTVEPKFFICRYRRLRLSLRWTYRHPLLPLLLLLLLNQCKLLILQPPETIPDPVYIVPPLSKQRRIELTRLTLMHNRILFNNRHLRHTTAFDLKFGLVEHVLHALDTGVTELQGVVGRLRGGRTVGGWNVESCRGLVGGKMGLVDQAWGGYCWEDSGFELGALGLLIAGLLLGNSG